MQVVFIDFLTKWLEVYPVADQTTLTIAKLLVEKFIPRHGVPRELLSDRESAFLSKLMADIYELTGIHKLNTTAYHPQTDGLVERFHRTLTSMLATTVEQGGEDWDVKLPYVLFAYRASIQESTQESPFFLLYGRDPQLPTDAMLSPPVDRHNVDVDDFKSEMTLHMSEAWELARASVKKAQHRQKKQYNRRAKSANFKTGDRVFVFMPGAKRGKAYKFTRAFHGPFRVVEMMENGAIVKPVDRPQEDSVRVAIDRLRACPVEVPDQSWPSHHVIKPRKTLAKDDHEPSTNRIDSRMQGVWSGRLRSHTGRGRPTE